MDISCLMITTNRFGRIPWTLRALDSIESNAKCTFKEKILSVDMLHGESMNISAFCKYEALGWKIIVGDCTGYRGMINNQLRGLEHITSEMLFYCEDHIVIERVPSIDMLHIIFDGKDNIKWLNYNTHIIEENLINKRVSSDREQVLIKEHKCLKYISTRENYVIYGEDCFLLKSLELADEYYLNFPATITTTKIFKLLLATGCKHYQDIGIEVGFTKAWFDCQLAYRFNVAIYVKPTVIPTKIITFDELHDNAYMRFRNNDLSMWHDSIAKHDNMPGKKKHRNSFF